VVQTLSEMRADECGSILEIHGGQGLLNRLGALGIIPGKKITKISTASMRGPVTIQVNRTQVAPVLSIFRAISSASQVGSSV